MCLFPDAFSKASLQAEMEGHGSAQGRPLCLWPEIDIDCVIGKASGLCRSAPASPTASSEPCSKVSCGDRSAGPQHPVWKQQSDWRYCFPCKLISGGFREPLLKWGWPYKPLNKRRPGGRLKDCIQKKISEEAFCSWNKPEANRLKAWAGGNFAIMHSLKQPSDPRPAATLGVPLAWWQSLW